jgi:polysaccharide export outer membrane protein
MLVLISRPASKTIQGPNVTRHLAALLAALALLVPATAAAAERATAPAEEYVIGIGDVLRVSVWKNPELDTTVPVRPDGNISLPLLGDLRALGMRPLELQRVLDEAYERFVTAPGTTVIVTEIHSRKVFVTGEVAEPGVFDLQPNMRLLQALAMAGGLTPYAKDRVVVLRQVEGGEERIEVRPSRIISGRDLDGNLLLRPGDTLVVP